MELTVNYAKVEDGVLIKAPYEYGGITNFNYNETMCLLYGFKPVKYSKQKGNKAIYIDKGDYIQEEWIDDLEIIKTKKIEELMEYDSSTNINEFSVHGINMWLSKDVRVSIKMTLDAAKLQGIENYTLWSETQGFTLPIDIFINMLMLLETYASQCYNITAQHKINIKFLTSVEEIINYDFTKGYPNKLSFLI